jgi:hypothetical protein
MNSANNHSLREILARSGIESSYARDRRRAKQRVERLGAGQLASVSPLPGIEVSYLEFDPHEWHQFEAAT